MNFKIPDEVLFIIDTFHNNGFDAHIVGGCVRDCIINRVPNDWDVTTNALPESIMELFAHTVPTGIKHGTVTVIINTNPYEVTTYRIDGEYSDNRHPDEVIFTDSLTEDLSRRDFTINAMAYSGKSGLIDPFHGLKDLENRIVRCVGDPNKRFNEDALRMIRAIRFACQLDFSIEEATFQAIGANSKLLKNISVERIREEFNKILLSSKPSKGIVFLKESGLLQLILPEIMPCIGFKQRNPHHHKDVFEHTLSVLDNSPENLVVRLAALFHDIGKPETFTVDEKGIGHFHGHQMKSMDIAERVLKRFKFDNNTLKSVIVLVKEHMNRHEALRTASIKKFINRVGLENLEDLFELQIADIKGSASPFDFSSIHYMKEEVTKILETKQPLTVKELALTGSDLLALGFKPGKLIGDILNHLLDAVLEKPELNTREQLIELVKTYGESL
jgi:tRNA nucleotidyltransferase (CCA-adding enzyme)